MKVKKYKPDDVIYVEDEIAVILEGIVLLKSHGDQVLPPKLLAKYEQGDIIGYSPADNGVSTREESWCIV